MSLQLAAAAGLDGLAARHEAAAGAAEARWDALARGADALEARQGRYEDLQVCKGPRRGGEWWAELKVHAHQFSPKHDACTQTRKPSQAKLIGASEGLLQRTSDLRRLMELLLGAQAGAARLLERASARQLSARDLAFWAAALGAPLLLVGELDLKLGLAAIALAGYAAESALGLGRLRAAAFVADERSSGGGGRGALGALAAAATARLGIGGGGGGGGDAWLLRGAVGASAALFAAWRLRARGRAHRELLAEVKALRARLERVRVRCVCVGCREGRVLRGPCGKGGLGSKACCWSKSTLHNYPIQSFMLRTPQEDLRAEQERWHRWQRQQEQAALERRRRLQRPKAAVAPEARAFPAGPLFAVDAGVGAGGKQVARTPQLLPPPQQPPRHSLLPLTPAAPPRAQQQQQEEEREDAWRHQEPDPRSWHSCSGEEEPSKPGDGAGAGAIRGPSCDGAASAEPLGVDAPAPSPQQPPPPAPAARQRRGRRGAGAAGAGDAAAAVAAAGGSPASPLRRSGRRKRAAAEADLAEATSGGGGGGGGASGDGGARGRPRR